MVFRWIQIRIANTISKQILFKVAGFDGRSTNALCKLRHWYVIELAHSGQDISQVALQVHVQFNIRIWEQDGHNGVSQLEGVTGLLRIQVEASLRHVHQNGHNVVHHV